MAVRNIEGIRVSSSTAGNVSPLSFEHLRVNYRYGGDKPLEDDPVPGPNAGAAARTSHREARKARFAAILAEHGHTDLTVRIPPRVFIKAGEQVGVTAKIARKYLAELRQAAS